MALKDLTASDVISSLSNKNIIYEIQGASAYFGYDLKGSAFFLERSLQTRTEDIDSDCLKVVRAMFRCINIDTVNPRSIWMKCKFEKTKKIIQAIDIGSSGITLTKKKCADFLEKIDDVQYGHFHIVKSPGVFSYNQESLDKYSEEILNFVPSLDIKISELSGDSKKLFFQKLENVLLLNGKSRIENWSILDCRSILIATHKGNFRVFRGS